MKRYCKGMLAAALALALPACAAAVTDGVVESAPAVEMEEERAQAEDSYLPDASYYAYDVYLPDWEEADGQQEPDGETDIEVEQRPRMTSGEAARARALLGQVQSGEIAYTGESVLEKMEDVVVGVYALDPADYDGETVFTLLPGTCLTDEQLLAIIDAHAQLGLTFDPDALNARNCARGGGIETTRFFTPEEAERYIYMAELIQYGRMDAQRAGAAQAVRNPRLNSAYYCGMEDFSLKPYRSMTDGELLSLLLEQGVQDESSEFDFAAMERDARAVLNGRLGCPLSMRLEGISTQGGYVPSIFTAQGERDWQGEGRRSYSATFSYTDAQGVMVYANVVFDWETKELVDASAMDVGDENAPDERSGADSGMHERISAALDAAQERLGLSGLTWYLQDVWTDTNWGACLTARALLEDGLWLTAYIGEDDGCLHGVSLERGTLVEHLPQEEESNG